MGQAAATKAVVYDVSQGCDTTSVISVNATDNIGVTSVQGTWTGVAGSPQVIRHSKRMVARNFAGATFTAALRHKDAAYAVALAESLLAEPPLVGRAAVQAY